MRNWVFIADIVMLMAFVVLSGMVGILVGGAYPDSKGGLWLVMAVSVICGSSFVGYRLLFKK